MNRTAARVLAALGIIVAAVVLPGTSAAAEPAAVPPWGTSVNWGGTESIPTGWSMSPHLPLADPMPTSTRRYPVWLGEPYWGTRPGAASGTAASVVVPLRFSILGPYPQGQTAWPEVAVKFRTICQNISTLAYTENTANNSYPLNISAAPGTTGTGYQEVSGCGTGSRPGGLAAYVTVIRDGVTHFSQRMVWFPEDVHEFAPGDLWCRDAFGPNYTATSTFTQAGVTYTAGEMGCKGDIITDPGGDGPPDPNTDFAVVCADAPVAEWLSFAWIDDWVGHYASCLFAPRGGWDSAGAIGAAWDTSAVAPAIAAVDGMQDVSFSGACGTLSSGSLMGTTVSVNTCTWPTYPTITNVIGVGIQLFAAWHVLGMLIAALGIDFAGLPVPHRTLYLGD